MGSFLPKVDTAELSLSRIEPMNERKVLLDYDFGFTLSIASPVSFILPITDKFLVCIRSPLKPPEHNTSQS